MAHESLWITQHLGTAPTQSHGPSGARLEPKRGDTSGPGIGELCLPVAGNLAGRGRGGLSTQAGAWGSAQLVFRGFLGPPDPFRHLSPATTLPELLPQAFRPIAFLRRDDFEASQGVATLAGVARFDQSRQSFLHPPTRVLLDGFSWRLGSALEAAIGTGVRASEMHLGTIRRPLFDTVSPAAPAS
jgi:hypothetical protein